MRQTTNNAAPSPVNARIPVGFGDLYLSAGDHVAHFYSRDEEWLDLAAGFFDAGLTSGDKCVCVVRPGAREEQLKQRLSDRGMPVEAALASRQLVLFEGKDKPSEMQEELAHALAEIPDGYPLLRWAGDMSWSLQRMPTTEKLMEWESHCNMVENPPAVFLCQYDLRAFLGSVVMDAMKTHPLCVVGNAIHRNPFYQRPEEFLAEMSQRPPTALV